MGSHISTGGSSYSCKSVKSASSYKSIGSSSSSSSKSSKSIGSSASSSKSGQVLTIVGTTPSGQTCVEQLNSPGLEPEQIQQLKTSLANGELAKEETVKEMLLAPDAEEARGRVRDMVFVVDAGKTSGRG